MATATIVDDQSTEDETTAHYVLRVVDPDEGTIMVPVHIPLSAFADKTEEERGAIIAAAVQAERGRGTAERPAITEVSDGLTIEL